MSFDRTLIRSRATSRLHHTPLTCVLLMLASSAARADESANLNRTFHQDVLPFLKSHCLDCHGKQVQEAKLNLSGYTTAESVAKGHQTWEIVLERVAAGEMPPEDAKQPSPEARQKLVTWIKAARAYEAKRNAGDPGPVLARRLSNAEYNYSIRDLTGVDIQPTKTFPVDPANESGFDNSGESLTMSPALLRKYLDAARQVAEHLVLKPNGIAFAPHPVVTDTDRDKYCVKRIVQFYKRQPTDLADYFFAALKYRHRQQRGRTNVTLKSLAKSANISPKYLATVWQLLTDDRNDVGPIRKLRSIWSSLPNPRADVVAAHDGCQKMKSFVVELREKLKPTFPNIKVEGSHFGSQTFVLWKNRQKVAHRRKFDGRKLIPRNESLDRKDPDIDLLVPANEPQRRKHEAAFARFCSVFPDTFYVSERGRDYVKESQKQMGEKGRLLSAGFHSMMGYFRDDDPLYDMVLDELQQQELDRLWQELDFVASAPMRQYVGFLWFERTDSRYMRDPVFDFARPENKASQSEPMIKRLAKVYLEKAEASGGGEVELEAIRHYFREINEQIRWVENARRAAEPTHIRAVLDFAAKAYRRKFSTTEKDSLAAFYRTLRDDGLTHEEAIQDTLVSILMSPEFCYRVDLIGIGDGRRALTADELASRLSYFLWSSTPDAELLRVAADGTLTRGDVLIAQTRRMLRDAKVRGLAVEFGGNWLDIRRFEEHNSVDRERFPQFSDDLRQAMFEEPVRFIMDVAQRDRSVLEFLNGRHTFANPVLAKHYGIAPDQLKTPDADGWSQVERADSVGRGGLLPMSVFLTKNAPGLRTSPVKRGYWVVRRLLGERIPPPPPNVPELPKDESKLGDLTLRQALAKHRDNKSCAGCHERFDSIGLAFEGFGPIGERRKLDLGGRPVSTTAVFPGGDEGTGVDDLRTYLRTHRQDEFLDNTCRKLLSYALGRSLILSDDLLLDEMKNKLKSDGYRFGSLVESIVTSPQFLNKRGAGFVQQK